MAELERALFLHALPDTPPKDFVRLYAGAEFCPWRMPTMSDLARALDWARRAAWRFTLVTPVLIEPCRAPLRATFEALLQKMLPTDEVLISDWGTLEMIREIRPDQAVILGRALSGQKRGPRILDLDLSEEQQAYFRQGSWYATAAAELLEEMNVQRVELDNLLQGLDPLPAGLVGSLHYPYAMVSSSRNCPFRSHGLSDPCPAPCGEVFTLSSDETTIPLYQGGNTQFLKNDLLPRDIDRLGVDRLVFHPELPR